MNPYVILAIVVALGGLFAGLKWDEKHHYNLGYNDRGAADQIQIDNLKADYAAKLKEREDRASAAEKGYDTAKQVLDDYIRTHPVTPVRLRACAAADSGGLRARTEPGGEAATARPGGDGGVHGSDNSMGAGRDRDIGPLLRAYAVTCQDFADTAKVSQGKNN